MSENIESVEKSIQSETDSSKKSGGAKKYSLMSMIVAGIWIGVLTVLKGFGKINLDVTEEIIPTGITLAGVFSPVYISILLDKIKDIRIGKGEN